MGRFVWKDERQARLGTVVTFGQRGKKRAGGWMAGSDMELSVIGTRADFCAGGCKGYRTTGAPSYADT